MGTAWSDRPLASAVPLSRSAVYQLIRTRQLPSVTIGRARRIPLDDLIAYLHHLTRQEQP